MKSTLFLTAALLLAGWSADTQTLKSFWVIESNLHEKANTLILFYDDQNNLIHQEVLKGKTLNIFKRKDMKFLDRKLKKITERYAFASGDIKR